MLVVTDYLNIDVTGEPGDTEDEETFRYFKKDDIPKDLYMAQYTCEGCLKRKTLLKNGKKPAVSRNFFNKGDVKVFNMVCSLTNRMSQNS